MLRKSVAATLSTIVLTAFAAIAFDFGIGGAETGRRIRLVHLETTPLYDEDLHPTVRFLDLEQQDEVPTTAPVIVEYWPDNSSPVDTITTGPSAERYEIVDEKPVEIPESVPSQIPNPIDSTATSTSTDINPQSATMEGNSSGATVAKYAIFVTAGLVGLLAFLAVGVYIARLNFKARLAGVDSGKTQGSQDTEDHSDTDLPSYIDVEHGSGGNRGDDSGRRDIEDRRDIHVSPLPSSSQHSDQSASQNRQQSLRPSNVHLPSLQCPKLDRTNQKNHADKVSRPQSRKTVHSKQNLYDDENTGESRIVRDMKQAAAALNGEIADTAIEL